MNTGLSIFQNQMFDDRYQAIDLFLKLQRSIYGSQESNPVTTEYALMETINKDSFMGVTVGGNLTICLVPCQKCQPTILN